MKYSTRNKLFSLQFEFALTSFARKKIKNFIVKVRVGIFKILKFVLLNEVYNYFVSPWLAQTYKPVADFISTIMNRLFYLFRITFFVEVKRWILTT